MKLLGLALAVLILNEKCDLPKPQPSPSPTQVPTPSPVPTPTPTSTPEPSPTATPIPTPTPTPEPTPPPTSQVTTVDRIILLTVAGSPCKIPGDQFVWTVDCEYAFVTATPKEDNGTDAKHGRNLRWFIGKVIKENNKLKQVETCLDDNGVIENSGCHEITNIVDESWQGEACSQVWSQGEETLFNKWFAPKEACFFSIWIGLQEPKTIKHPTGYFWQSRNVTVKQPKR